MKKLLLAFFIALPLLSQTVSLCGTPADPGSSSVSSMTVTCTPTAGAFLVLWAVTGPSITQTFSDGGVGNTISTPSVTNLAGFPNWVSTGGGSGAYNIKYITSAVGSATTFTVTNSGSSTFNSFVVIQVTGAASVSPVDCGNHNFYVGTATPQNSGNCTTTQTGDFLFGFANQYASPGAVAAGTGVSQLFKSTGSGSAVEYVVAGAAGAYNLAWTLNGVDADIFMVAVKPASAQSMSVSPTTIYQTSVTNSITATGTGTSWVPGTTTYSLVSGGTGASVSGSVVTTTTAGTFNVSAGTALGNLTIGNSADSATAIISVVVPTVTASPSSVVQGSTGNSIVLTCVGCTWTASNPTFSVSGGSGAAITARTITDDTHCTITLTAGSATGTLTVTNSRDSSTASITVASTPPVSAVISALTVYATSATTLTVRWTTDLVASTGLACSTTPGVFTQAGVDDDSAQSYTSHNDSLGGLAPGAQYYCRASSTNAAGTTTATISGTTTATPATTPLIGVRMINPSATDGIYNFNLGTRYNLKWPTDYVDGDSHYNTACKIDPSTYLITNDHHGFDQPVTGTHYTGSGYNQSIQKLSGTPLFGTFINGLSSMGTAGGTGSDGLTSKGFGLVCLNDFYQTDALYMSGSRQSASASDGHRYGGFWRSNDYGATWANWTAKNTYNAGGSQLSDLTSNFFGANNPLIGGTWTRFSIPTPVLYSPGNSNTSPLVDQQDVFQYYLMGGVTSTNSLFSNGDDSYLLRVPRSKMANMSGSDWQWYIGDGVGGRAAISADASWSASSSGALSIIHNTGRIGWESMQWLPDYNRYLLTTTIYNAGTATTAQTQIVWYEAPKPNGPFTEIFRMDTLPQGHFGSIPLQASIGTFAANHTLRVLFSGDYSTYAAALNDTTNFFYTLFYADFEILSSPPRSILAPLTYGNSTKGIPLSGAMALYDFSNSDGAKLIDRSTNGKHTTLADADKLTGFGAYFPNGLTYDTALTGDPLNGNSTFTDFTVAVLFFQPSALNGIGTNHTIVSKLNPAGNAVNFAILRNGTTANNYGFSVFGTTAYGTFSDDAWHLAIVRRNATTGVVEIFKDGSTTALASATAATTAMNNTKAFRLGNTSLATDDCYCMVQAFGAWDRVLRADEMAAMYAAIKASVKGKGITLP